MSDIVIKRREVVQQPQFSHVVSPILQRIYATRGVTCDEDLQYGLDNLSPFSLLQGIDKAIDRLCVALSKQQRILIIGDFDTDGATSTALAVRALRLLGARFVEYLVPNRFEYGYGLTTEIVSVAAQSHPDLIITVDNGISSIAGVNAAKEKGIDVIVTDHHLPADELPQADAIVNPNQPGDTFPSKHLAGVGVIFYVMLALRRKLCEVDWFVQEKIEQPNMGQFLGLVALGTIADVVTLDRNNRILVHQGLSRIRAGKCPQGIIALLEISKRKLKRVVASDLGYAIAPRLNAAGRLDDMSVGIECLLTDDLSIAREKANLLDELNQERRAIEADMKNQALGVLETFNFNKKELPLGVCLYDASWHQGVIGILAGRLKDKLHRPVIAFAKVNENELKGSARSIQGINIRDILNAIAVQHPQVINKFGGHAMAAGLTLSLDNLEEFSDAFSNEIAKCLKENELRREILSDGELTASDCTYELAEHIRQGGPWGQHFPEPLFEGKFSIVQQRIIGKKHLKLLLSLMDSRYVFDAIAFNIDEREWPNYDCQSIHATYRLDINEYNGAVKLQLILEYLKPIR